MSIRLRFGQPGIIPEGAPAAWGARMIVGQGGYVDMVHDRQDCGGEAVSELLDKLNYDGVLAELKEQIATLLREGKMRSDRGEDFVIFQRDGIEAHANTNGSYGYCYVTAWLTGDES